MAKKFNIGCLGFLISFQLMSAPPVKEAESTFVSKDSKLWTEPTRFGEPIAILKTGVELTIKEYSSNQSWVKVATPAGREGWVPLRFTTQSGRRSFPLNAELGKSSLETAANSTSDNRAPASVSEEKIPEAADLDKAVPEGTADLKISKSENSSWEGVLGLEYMNQLSREKTSGFGTDISMLYRIHNSWSIGGAISWDMFTKSLTDESNGNSTSRSSHRISPQVLARFRYSSFRLDMGLGYAIDKSKVETRLDDGTLAPAEFNGSSTESSLAIKITPRIILPMSRGLKVGFYLSYILDIALGSGDGDLTVEGEDAVVSPPYHYMGAGISLGVDF